MSKRIEITIGLEGEVSLEAVGYTGSSCEQATKDYEEAFGSKGKTKKKKAEYFQKDNQKEVAKR